EVGLDPDETIDAFLAQLPHDGVAQSAHTAPAVEDHEAVESERRTASTFLRLIAFSVPIAAAVIYFGMAGRSSPPPSESSAPEPSPPASATVEETPPTASDVAAASQPVVKPPAKQAPAATPASRPLEPIVANPAAPTSGTLPTTTAPAVPRARAVKPDEISRLTVEL